MTCPDCGYMMSAFDKECPRCKRNPPKPKPPPAPAPPTEPVAVAQGVASVAPAENASRSVSSVSIAASVICGILCVIGILLLVGGGIALTQYRAPIYNTDTNISASNTEGGYLSPWQINQARKIARMESVAYAEEISGVMGAGLVFCVPMIVLAAKNARKRKR